MKKNISENGNKGGSARAWAWAAVGLLDVVATVLVLAFFVRPAEDLPLVVYGLERQCLLIGAVVLYGVSAVVALWLVSDLLEK